MKRLVKQKGHIQNSSCISPLYISYPWRNVVPASFLIFYRY